MRGLEAVQLLGALIAVPALGWGLGRHAGRRDWPVLPVILAAAAVAVAVEGLAALARMLAVPAATIEGTMPLEAAAFLVVLAVFVAMIGWTSVPAAGKGRDVKG